MPVYMDDISTIGNADDIRKGIRNCAVREKKKKFTYGMKKTKYMVTGKDEEEKIEEKVEAGIVEKTKTYKYMGLMINEKGNLEDHILYKKSIVPEIMATVKQVGSESQVGEEWLRVQLQLYETCLVSSLIHGIECWSIITDDEINKFEEKIEYQTLMLYHNLINSDEERESCKIIG